MHGRRAFLFLGLCALLAAPGHPAEAAAPPQPVIPRPSPVKVRHLPKKGGWCRAETTHFRIFHLTDNESAEEIARVAQQTLVRVAQTWFGEKPAEWEVLC